MAHFHSYEWQIRNTELNIFALLRGTSRCWPSRLSTVGFLGGRAPFKSGRGAPEVASATRCVHGHGVGHEVGRGHGSVVPTCLTLWRHVLHSARHGPRPRPPGRLLSGTAGRARGAVPRLGGGAAWFACPGHGGFVQRHRPCLDCPRRAVRDLCGCRRALPGCGSSGRLAAQRSGFSTVFPTALPPETVVPRFPGYAAVLAAGSGDRGSVRRVGGPGGVVGAGAGGDRAQDGGSPAAVWDPEWSLAASALANAVAVVKAVLRGQPDVAAGLLERGLRRVGASGSASGRWRADVVRLADAAAQHEPAQRPLADQVKRLAAELLEE